MTSPVLLTIALPSLQRYMRRTFFKVKATSATSSSHTDTMTSGFDFQHGVFYNEWTDRQHCLMFPTPMVARTDSIA